MSLLLIPVVLVFMVLFAIIVPMLFRIVVPTNMVHIVQSRKQRTSYGSTAKAGNVYYSWPSWIPIIGIKVIELPVSVFDLSLNGYSAYDVDRVPFKVDVTAFFRIENTNLASERASSVTELQEQLTQIVQGAVRTILAGDKIDNIMGERSKFGNEFTEEISKELQNWGVITVKNMELMDIRDSEDSRVIENIMAKKQSGIEKESRVVVAENMRTAKEREIDAQRDIDLRDQEAKRLVGEKTAEKDKLVGIANEIAQQEIKDQQKITTEKEMEVVRVSTVKQAEITKSEQVIVAEQEKDTTVIMAEGELEKEKRNAQGITIVGEAEANAEKAMQLAPVEAQIVLAKEIGENEGYQNYLISLEAINAQEKIGIAQAKALEESDLKIIANSGSVNGGVSNMSGSLNGKFGTNIAAMFEAFSNSEIGGKISSKLLGEDDEG